MSVVAALAQCHCRAEQVAAAAYPPCVALCGPQWRGGSALHALSWLETPPCILYPPLEAAGYPQQAMAQTLVHLSAKLRLLLSWPINQVAISLLLWQLN